MKKHFVLDTNILLEDPQNIFGFDDNHVIITGTTLQELDSKKRVPGEIGYNARECCRILDSLREQGDLLKGVKLKNKGILSIEPDGVKQEYLPDGFYISNPDNRIISSCVHLNKRYNRNHVILVTSDVSMRISATACGINVQNYKNSVVRESGYSGHIDIDCTKKMLKEIREEGLIPIENEQGLLENEFVTLHAGEEKELSIYQDGGLYRVQPQGLFGGVQGMNDLQNYAIHALMAPVSEIPLVILCGPAGTAKTFLSLAAGLSNVYTGRKRNRTSMHKILISRPNAETSDPSFGYLPGSLEEKMMPLLAPYMDNLEDLVSHNYEEDISEAKIHIDDMFESGLIEVCALAYIRGRSIRNSWIICDEAQNANSKLIKSVITRSGQNSKVVICGDPDQCDVSNLSKEQNGLRYAIETMKGSKTTAIVTFNETHSVRSELAAEAIRRMK